MSAQYERLRNDSYLPSLGMMPDFTPDFGDLNEEHLAAIGRVAIAFGHVEFLTSEFIGHLAEDD